MNLRYWCLIFGDWEDPFCSSGNSDYFDMKIMELKTAFVSMWLLLLASYIDVAATVTVTCPKTISLRASEDHIISCNYIADHIANGFYWKKNTILVVRYENNAREVLEPGYNITEDGALVIYNATVDDSGTYTFLVSTSISTHGSDVLKINVLENETKTTPTTAKSTVQTSTAEATEGVMVPRGGSAVVPVLIILFIVIVLILVIAAFFYRRKQKEKKENKDKNDTDEEIKMIAQKKDIEADTDPEKQEAAEKAKTSEKSKVQGIETFISSKYQKIKDELSKSLAATRNINEIFSEKSSKKTPDEIFLEEIYLKYFKEKKTDDNSAASQLLSEGDLETAADELFPKFTESKELEGVLKQFSKTEEKKGLFIIKVMRRSVDRGTTSQDLYFEVFIGLITNEVPSFNVYEIIKDENRNRLMEIIEILRQTAKEEKSELVTKKLTEIISEARGLEIDEELTIDVLTDLAETKMISDDTCRNMCSKNLEISSNLTVKTLILLAAKGKITPKSCFERLELMKLSEERYLWLGIKSTVKENQNMVERLCPLLRFFVDNTNRMSEESIIRNFVLFNSKKKVTEEQVTHCLHSMQISPDATWKIVNTMIPNEEEIEPLCPLISHLLRIKQINLDQVGKLLCGHQKEEEVDTGQFLFCRWKILTEEILLCNKDALNGRHSMNKGLKPKELWKEVEKKKDSFRVDVFLGIMYQMYLLGQVEGKLCLEKIKKLQKKSQISVNKATEWRDRIQNLQEKEERNVSKEKGKGKEEGNVSKEKGKGKKEGNVSKEKGKGYKK